MSATRDKTQKTAFVYSNLYQMYRKEQEAGASPGQSYFQLPGTLATEHNVLKSADLRAQAAPQVRSYSPPGFLAKRIVNKPQVLTQANPAQSAAIQSLKDNLKTLNDLHSRLKFMLQELETLIKD